MSEIKSRRSAIKTSLLAAFATIAPTQYTHARTYLTKTQAKHLLFGNVKAKKQTVNLTKEQMKAIKSASRVRVRSSVVNAYRTPAGDWLIFDQIIGKHENIDIAVGLTKAGKVKGVEILVYRETYGHEIRGAKWRAQFHGKDHTEHLLLDKQIRNISGATLSCRHVTDAINRWTKTWDMVLKHQPRV